MFDLPTIWAALISLALLAYVVLDGFDLGIGILFGFGRTKEQRDTMMNTVAPVWDGNETWLVLGGGGLFAAFPAGLFDPADRVLCTHHRNVAGPRTARCCL